MAERSTLNSFVSHTESETPSLLTKLQEELLYSIETQNISYFIDLGGDKIADLNFAV